MIIDDYIIGYSKISNEKYELHLKCRRCGEKFKKTIRNDKVSILKCNGCNEYLVFIPVEVKEETGEIIDFYIMTYYEYSKSIKEWEKNVRDKNENIDKQEMDKLRLNYIISVLVST